MKHLGDIMRIDGACIEAVDCIIGGSPCQDLSVAGKRAGLFGARSGLFMEQIRIIKEMRKKYGKPRYMVWENVPGAFSSNKGEDFRVVLEEIVRIIDESAVIPRPPKSKWTYAGCIVGDGYSVAWRIHNAQFWGVPQSRRRIALVADFGGSTAPEILFERSDEMSSCQMADRAGEKSPPGTFGNPFIIQGNHINRKYDWDGSIGYRLGTCYTLTLVDRHCIAYDDMLRKLTPLECERLQGFPDNWTAFGDISDSRRYELCGNSIALPFWRWLVRRLPDCNTMGSLFDGMGGFPLVWEETHGKGTARWSSEIDHYAVELTTLHFGDK